MLRFLSNIYDFVLVLFFYNHIMKMYNFWDQLFFETVQMEASDPEIDDEKRRNLEIELSYAALQLKKNNRNIEFFNRMYIALNLLIFVCQVFYILINPPISMIGIFIFGTALFLMDIYMVLMYYITIKRFIQLIC